MKKVTVKVPEELDQKLTAFAEKKRRQQIEPDSCSHRIDIFSFG